MITKYYPRNLAYKPPFAISPSRESHLFRTGYIGGTYKPVYTVVSCCILKDDLKIGQDSTIKLELLQTLLVRYAISPLAKLLEVLMLDFPTNDSV